MSKAKLKAKQKRARRLAQLAEQLLKNPLISLTWDQMTEFAQSVWNNKETFSAWNKKLNPHYVVDPELAGKSICQLVEERVLTVYFGEYTSLDRAEIEPYGFMSGDTYNPYWRWQDSSDARPRRFRKGEVKELEFKHLCFWSALLEDGFEGHMMERAFHYLSENMEAGYQRLNRVTGVGNPHRGVACTGNVFMTYAKVSDLIDHPKVVMDENFNKLLNEKKSASSRKERLANGPKLTFY
jgi:hypothetical protein